MEFLDPYPVTFDHDRKVICRGPQDVPIQAVRVHLLL